VNRRVGLTWLLQNARDFILQNAFLITITIVCMCDHIQTRISLVKLNQRHYIFVTPNVLHLVYIDSQSQRRIFCLLSNKNRSCANSANKSRPTKNWTIFHVTRTTFVAQHCRPIKLSDFYWSSDISLTDTVTGSPYNPQFRIRIPLVLT